MPGMDLNQNTQDYERDRMMERINEHERVLNGLTLETVKKIPGVDKLMATTMRVVRGNLEKIDGEEIDIDASDDGLEDGSATNRYLVWNTTTEAWEPAELIHPAGSTDNRFLTWDAANSKWIATELIHPAGDVDNPFLRWSVANAKWMKAAGTALEPSTVDGHLLETYDNAGTKEVRWGFARMKNI